ncbi:glycosyltransferase family 4 protein [Marinilactibacillus sp. Marseille-P9653]|uniref:glycosyltransferase family 4 protein n=1 Tax=Marinilactibacillus sp. Marseille-P9653 TaxID=2866583 RepID=UPI001CE3DDAA|nr:glycosyltransferase family 4 protein [Marinilactibacillus sp. Marseille-P9653]
MENKILERNEMKILHINAGNEYGGGLFHIMSLFQGIDKIDMELLVFEEGPVAENARKNGISVTVLPQRSRYDLSILSKLRKWINQNQFDIVHSHGPRANLLVGLIRSTMKAKWITTIHSDPTLDFQGRGLKGKVFEWLNLKSLTRPDHLIAISGEIKRILVQRHVNEQHITVVHNGRAFEQSISQQRISDKRNHFKMITVGRLEWVKGHRHLIEALKLVRFDNWELNICGIGEQELALRESVEKAGLKEKVHFLGWIEAKAVGDQIVESDILINPSLSESFPLVALEAGENKRPVIATDVGDVKEMIPDKTIGWLIPAEDPIALAQAIEEAYFEWEQGTLKIKGTRFYEWSKQFTIEKQGLETMEVYRNCL